MCATGQSLKPASQPHGGFDLVLPGRDGTGQCYTQSYYHAHLYFSSLNHGAVQSVSCALRISTICECYKTEPLHAETDKTCIINSSSNSCNDMMTLDIRHASVQKPHSTLSLTSLIIGSRVRLLYTVKPQVRRRHSTHTSRPTDVGRPGASSYMYTTTRRPCSYPSTRAPHGAIYASSSRPPPLRDTSSKLAK